MKRQPAFSLVELIVVLLIIGVLAGIGFPIYQSFRSRADNVACINNLRQISFGLEAYLQEHNNIMPPFAMGAGAPENAPQEEEASQPIEIGLLSYVGGDPQVFRCPADDRLFSETGSSYFYTAILAGQNKLNYELFGSSVDSQTVPIVYDKEAFHGGKNGSNILYADYTTDDRVRFTLPPAP